MDMMDSDDEESLSVGSSIESESMDDVDFLEPGEGDSDITTSIAHTEEINRKLMQEQLVLLLHAQKCQIRQGQGDESCTVQNCEATMNLLDHMRTCNADKRCKVDHCTKSYQVIGHWGNCEEKDCKLCSALKIYTSEEPKSSCKGNPFKYLYTRKQISDILDWDGPSGSIIADLEETVNIFSINDRKSLMELTNNGFNLLCWSCYTGNLNLAKFLIERYGAYDFINVYTCDAKRIDTPLYNAILKEHINIARYLLHNKADPNIHNGRGTYPLFETYFDNQNPDIEAFKLLIDHGADINKATIITMDTVFHGQISGTGDEFNVEVIGEKVINYVDNFNEYHLSDDFNECAYIGEDEHPLIYSAIHDQYKLFKYIVQHPDVPTIIKINAYEVLGATRILQNKINDALTVLKVALKMRYEKKEQMYPKQLAESKEEFMELKEINSIDELANYPQDFLHMSIQALLILERTVPSYLRYNIIGLLYLRDLYEDRNRFSLGLKLDLKIQQICHEKAPQRLDSFLLFEYAKSLYNMLYVLDRDEWLPTFKDIFLACEQSIHLLCCSQKIYKGFPEPPFDTIGPPTLTFSLGCCVVSIQYLVRRMKAYPSTITKENKAMFHTFMEKLSSYDFRDEKEQTLLHIALLQSQAYFSDIDLYDTYEKLENIYSLDAVGALLQYGFNLNARDVKGNTPLHSFIEFINHSSDYYEGDIELITFLINKGVHLDTVNKNDCTITDLIHSSPMLDFLEIPIPSLTCLAATVVARSNVLFDSSDVPVEVLSVIQLHERP